MSKFIGIDFGTSFSSVSVFEEGKPKIIQTLDGYGNIPSIVAFKNGEKQVGELVKLQMEKNPTSIFSIKSSVINNENIVIEDITYTPQEISAMIIQYLKKCAEEYLDEKVTGAVIAVPAVFTYSQRLVITEACKIAGIERVRYVNGATAAALTYAFERSDVEHKILVFDLGGGTLDVSILEVDNGLCDVIATSGDNHLGGNDFDSIIVDYLVSEFKKEHAVNLSKDTIAMQRLRIVAEKAKKELSSVNSTQISLSFIVECAEGPLNMELSLTRAKFDELTHDLVERTMDPVRQALSDAGFSTSEFDKIILVGGSTRIPAVVEALKKVTGHEPYKGVNLDEAIAMGVAIQSGVLAHDINLKLLDVIPMSLGIETNNGAMTKIMNRNTPIPNSRSLIFSTATDNQSAVDILVLQGESSKAADNQKLASFQLSGIPSASSGVSQIEVNFFVDVDGAISVKAKDLQTQKEENIEIGK